MSNESYGRSQQDDEGHLDHHAIANKHVAPDLGDGTIIKGEVSISAYAIVQKDW